MELVAIIVGALLVVSAVVILCEVLLKLTPAKNAKIELDNSEREKNVFNDSLLFKWSSQRLLS